MIRIYLISNMYPTEAFPSFGVFVKNFAESIQDDQFRISSRTLIKGKKSKLSLVWSYLRFSIDVFFKANFSSYDIIYVHYVQHSLVPLNFWFRRKGKLILNAHGSDLTFDGLFYRLMRKLNSKFFIESDLMVIPSSFFKEKVISLGVKEEKIYVYPSGGIDLELFQPKVKKEEFLYRIGYLGRLDKGKGIEALIQAFAKLKNSQVYHLELVGAGQEEQSLRALADRVGISERCTFAGVKKQEELPIIFSTWDVMVFPSELEESLGLVGLEAMACGLPVIGSANGGIGTYLRDGINGFSFAPGNVEDLKNKVDKFFGLNLEDLKKLKENAISTAARYSRKTVNKEFKNRIKELLQS
ncbi:glycosyltransferase family 4 protein [Algoriphagus litoralis]|uniref:glycosyltransferase family 4 protein n=1 Tax=Algoriphagus litoralis TaxID=2202829 RepID=UPI000DB990B8|nr:glycosyltransferase family 4 protein [Algoriphagus litoralis]